MSVSLAALWLPILLAAVAVFIASSVIHMVIGWHNNAFRKLPDQEAVVDAIARAGVEPGDYLFPCADNPADNMKSPEVMAAWEKGPAGFLRVYTPGPLAMGKSLAHWFAYCVVVSLFAGYLGGATLGPGADYLAVFRVVGTAAFLAYAGSMWQEVIWFAAPVGNTIKSIVDGLVYALLTAGVFGWLWP